MGWRDGLVRSPQDGGDGVATEVVGRHPAGHRLGQLLDRSGLTGQLRLERRRSGLTGDRGGSCFGCNGAALVATLVILLGRPPWAQLAAQDYSFVACDLDRASLELEVLAHNPEVFPTLVAPPSRIPGGWLIYDRYERQVIELGDSLDEIARWGRAGPGPMEYSQPVAVWGSAEQVVVVDRDPPSVMLFGSDRSERALLLPLPIWDAAFFPAEDRLVLSVMGEGLYETTLFGRGEIRASWTYADLGIEVRSGTPVPFGGSPLVPRASPAGGLYVGSQWGSRIWHVEPAGPRLVLERCIPDGLRNQHIAPVRPGSARTTLQNFHILADGRILTHGALPVEVPDTERRSVELYGADGTLLAAWSIPFISAAFDPTNASRLLVWSEEVGLQLVTVSGPGYPSG